MLRSGPWRAAGPLRVLDDPAPTPAPASPTGLIAVAGDGLVDLTWTAPADNGSVISGYGILRGPSAGALATLVVDTNSTQVFYRDETVEAGADYVYAVVALTADAESLPSATASVTVPEESSEQEPGGGGQPAPPTGLVAVAGDGVVDLVWAAPSDNDNDNEIVISGYRIMRGANAGALATLVADSGSPLTFYRDETVEADADYVYAVVALSAGGESPPSATASVTIPALTSAEASGESDPLSAPTGLRAEASHNHVILTWDAADDDTISGYRVLRGPDAGRLTELASDTRSAFATYVDHAVEPETKYAYAVQAIRSGDVGPQSEAVSTRTREPAEEGTRAARAISDHIAVSNLNRTTGGGFSLTLHDSPKFATPFSSGNVATKLFGVGLLLGLSNTMSVSIWSDSSGEPGNKLHTLQRPSRIFVVGSATTFRSGGFTLAANTNYWVMLEGSAGVFLVTRDDSIHGRPAAGWNIGNIGAVPMGNGWQDASHSHVKRMAIYAAPAADLTTVTVTGVSIISKPLRGLVYRAGEYIELAYTFSQPVRYQAGAGSIWVAQVDHRSAWRGLGYVYGSGGNQLIFRYRVRPGDYDRNGFFISAQGLGAADSNNVISVAGDQLINLWNSAAEAGAAHQINGDSVGCAELYCAFVWVADISSGVLGFSGSASPAKGSLSNRTVGYYGNNVIQERLVRNVSGRKRLELLFAGPPSARLLDFLALQIGDRKYPFIDAEVSGNRLQWADSGLSWSANDIVGVRIVNRDWAVSNRQQFSGLNTHNYTYDNVVAQSFTTGPWVQGYHLNGVVLEVGGTCPTSTSSLVQVGLLNNISADPDGPQVPDRFYTLMDARWPHLDRGSSGLSAMPTPYWFNFQDVPVPAMLKANATYWLFVDQFCVGGSYSLAATSSPSDIGNLDDGWRIGDTIWERGADGWQVAKSAEGRRIKMEIRAERITAGAMEFGQRPVGLPVVTGLLELGALANADLGAIGDPQGMRNTGIEYLWSRQIDARVSEPIIGVEGSTYLIREEDVGHRLLVGIRYRDDSGTDEPFNSGVLWSDPSAVVRPAPDYVVSTIGLPSYKNANKPHLTNWQRQQFTVGNTPVTLKSVRLGLAASPGAEVEAAIFAADREPTTFGQSQVSLADQLTKLRAPEVIDRSLHTLEEFDAGGFRLEANTTYFLGVRTPNEGEEVWIGSVSAYFTARDPSRLTPLTAGSEDGWWVFTFVSPGSLPGSFQQNLAYPMRFGLVAQGPPAINSPAEGAPLIIGLLEPGTEVQAETSPISDNNGLQYFDPEYQWYRIREGQSERIEGATDSVYAIRPGDLGAQFQVELRFIDDDDFEERLISELSGVVHEPPVFTVSNLRQLSEGGIRWDNNPTKFDMATAFETGDSLLQVAGIRVSMYTQAVGLETCVWIFSDNGSNRLGTELHQLTTVTPSGEDRSTVRDFVANNVTLSPRTKYWLVIGKTPANALIAATATETGRIDGGGGGLLEYR